MNLLADKRGEHFLNIIEEDGDSVLVQFISGEGKFEGKPFNDSLKGLLLAGWSYRTTSTAIGMERFKQGYLEDAHVSFALHRFFRWGSIIRLPSGEIVKMASYANTHADGYYMYVRRNGGTLSLLKMTPQWQRIPQKKILALPYLFQPRTQKELDDIDAFDRWACGY